MPSDTNTTIGGLGLINVTKIYNAIEPYHTTLADLKQSGFDPNETKNLLRLGPEILRTDILMKNSSVKMEELPQGIQDCFKKSEECLGYQISEIEQERQGQGEDQLPRRAGGGHGKDGGDQASFEDEEVEGRRGHKEIIW